VQVVARTLSDGEDATASGTGNAIYNTITVPGTAKTIDIASFAMGVIAYSADDVILLTVHRAGANGADTATGDLHFIALQCVGS